MFPVVSLVAAATYGSIDPRFARAAASLGAAPWRILRTITLPPMQPALKNAVLPLEA